MKHKTPISPLQALTKQMSQPNNISQKEGAISYNNLNQRLKEDSEILIEASQCKPWNFHDRDNSWMNRSKCKDLISSIRKHGQKTPIFVRPLQEKNLYEIIAGKRRWFTCKFLKIPIKAKVVNIDNREGAILMHLENKDRKDISEFERAISYSKLLKEKIFLSQDDMSNSLSLSKSKLSKIINATKIMNHYFIAKLITDITKINISNAYKLSTLLSNDLKYSVIKKRASYVSTAKIVLINNALVLDLINSVERSEKTRSTKKAKTFCCAGGNKLLKCRYNTKGQLLFEFTGITSKIPTIEVNRLVKNAIDYYFVE